MFKGFAPKDAARKTDFFFNMYIISQRWSANQQKQSGNDAFHAETGQAAKH